MGGPEGGADAKDPLVIAFKKEVTRLEELERYETGLTRLRAEEWEDKKETERRMWERDEEYFRRGVEVNEQEVRLRPVPGCGCAVRRMRLRAPPRGGGGTGEVRMEGGGGGWGAAIPWAGGGQQHFGGRRYCGETSLLDHRPSAADPTQFGCA